VGTFVKILAMIPVVLALAWGGWLTFRGPVDVLEAETAAPGPESVIEDSGDAMLEPKSLDAGRFGGFFAMPPEGRAAIVDGQQGEYHLEPGEAKFLARALEDKRLDATTRNNIANILVAQERKDPDLYRLLLRMVGDAGEDALWRDYALQHLATTYPFSENQEAIRSVLLDLFERGEGDIAGTAMIHLDHFPALTVTGCQWPVPS